MPDSPNITQLLQGWQNGNEAAGAEAFRLVYKELRVIAQARLRGLEGNHNTLQTTALINEAYCKMVRVQQTWADRKHFYRVASRCMRQIVLDYIKAKKAGKRGLSVELDEAMLVPEADFVRLLEVDEALCRLAREHPEAAEAFELQYYGGQSVTDIAEIMGLDKGQIEKRLTFARAWLKREVGVQ